MLYNLAHILFFSATYAAILAQNETEISASDKISTITNLPKHVIVETSEVSYEESEEEHPEHTTIDDDEPRTTTAEASVEVHTIPEFLHEILPETSQPETSQPETSQPETTQEIFTEKTNEVEYTPATATEKSNDFVPVVRSSDPIRWPPPESSGSETGNFTRVYDVDAECQNDAMRIAITFNGSFSGLIYTSNFPTNPECIFVNGTGANRYEFFLELNKCGTLFGHPRGQREQKKKYMWNNLFVQYNPLIEGDQDEHYEVTCEYGYDVWKTVSFPFVEVQPMPEKVVPGELVNSSLKFPECYLEIRQGFGLKGPTIQGSVAVGDPLTLIIHKRSRLNEFDLVINNCVAHNGGNKNIILIDKHGCPADEKLISEFHGEEFHTTLYETQVFAYFKAFRFTGSSALYLECDVRMCHGKCPTQKCNWRRQKRSIFHLHLHGSPAISSPLKIGKSLNVRTDNLSKSVQIDDVSGRLNI